MTILFLILISVISAISQTLVSGVIERVERWTEEGSPYIVSNDIVIGSSGRLHIEPGVKVLIERPASLPDGIVQKNAQDSFSVKILVEGALYAVGTRQKPIIFKGTGVEDRYSHWYGIVINSNRIRETQLSHCRISDAFIGINVQRGMPIIKNTLFESNNIGIYVQSLATPRVVNSLFTDNFLAGARVENSNPHFYNSIFYANRNIGLWGDRVSEIIFENNLLWRNGDRDFVDVDPLFGVVSGTNRSGDSVDFKGNLFTDPIFLGSPEYHRMRKLQKQERDGRVWGARSDFDEGSVRPLTFELSPFSPAIDAGKGGRRFMEPDGSPADIGLFGGPEFIDF